MDNINLETIPEPSLITPNGLKYYSENDITSWLSGFNVLVLKLDEIITELNNRIKNYYESDWKIATFILNDVTLSQGNNNTYVYQLNLLNDNINVDELIVLNAKFDNYDAINISSSPTSISLTFPSNLRRTTGKLVVFGMVKEN